MRFAFVLFGVMLGIGGCCGGLQSAGDVASDEVELVTAAPDVELETPAEFGRPPLRLGKAGRHGGERFFARMDEDSDGAISKEEYRGTDERFAVVDADGDGRIEPTEFDAARLDRPARRGDFMSRHDANEDGKISIEEFEGKGTRFTKLDQNADGYIDKTEAPSGRRILAVEEGDAADEPSDAADTSQDEASQP